MDYPLTIDLIIDKLSSVTGKIFLYGSSPILRYKKKPIRIYRILSDQNIASLAGIIPGLRYSHSYRSDCCCQTFDGTPVLFLSCDSLEKKPVKFLKEAKKENDHVPLFDFSYNPVTDSYIQAGNFYSFSKNEIPSINLEIFSEEDIIDLCMLISGMNTLTGNVSGNTSAFSSGPGELMDLLEIMFTYNCPFPVLKFLDRIKLLEKIFPFLYDLQGIEQDRLLHPEGDVFDHTLNCFQYIKNPSLRLFYGLLLHDYGKFYGGKGQSRKKFYKHSTLGAARIHKILSPLGYPDDFINDIRFLVEYHMVNSYFFRLSHEERKNMFNNRLGVDLMKLFKADTMGSIGYLDIYQDIISLLKKDKKVKMFR